MSTPTDPRPREDVEEDALVQADLIAHDAFGADESRWTAAQVAGYLAALNTVHTAFTDSITSGLTESYQAYDTRMTEKEARDVRAE